MQRLALLAYTKGHLMNSLWVVLGNADLGRLHQEWYSSALHNYHCFSKIQSSRTVTFPGVPHVRVTVLFVQHRSWSSRLSNFLSALIVSGSVNAHAKNKSSWRMTWILHRLRGIFL